MSVLDQLAHAQGRRDEVPNQELAKKLAENRDESGIKAIIDGLNHKDRHIQNDCIKVSYEIGYISPELIAGYDQEFLTLLKSRNNRLVWGAMIALSTISGIKAAELFQHREAIKAALDKGSVITQDVGIRTLATIASTKDEFCDELFPYLLTHLETCRPKDLPRRAETIAMAVNPGNKAAFIEVIKNNRSMLTSTQMKRVDKVLREL